MVKFKGYLTKKHGGGKGLIRGREYKELDAG